MNDIPQFGEPLESSIERAGAYAVIQDDMGRVLVVFVKQKRFHLPGGGIDGDETAEAAAIREVEEETGYRIASLDLLGRANQFLETKDGNINKLATYFRAHIAGGSLAVKESDHEPQWIRPEAFLSSTANEFHKWAVRKALDL